MRCLVNLTAIKDQVYTPSYHVKLQGVIYDILEAAGYTNLHDKKPFKFLVFSNIFPPRDMEAGDERTLIISSPNDMLIEDIQDEIASRELLESGDQQYRIDSTTVFAIEPKRNGSMITGTPIIVRLSPEACREYGIDPGEYEDVYWRQDHDPQAFIDAVESNLAHKYEEYYNRDAPERPYFTGYTPRKEVSVPLHYAERTATLIGSTWELGYECPTREMHRLMRLAYSSGVGELNTTGFGFMNKVGE